MLEYNVYLIEDPLKTAERGKLTTLDRIFRERAGSDLESFTPMTRRLVGQVVFKEGTEVNRILDVESFRAVCPTVVRIELEQVHDVIPQPAPSLPELPVAAGDRPVQGLRQDVLSGLPVSKPDSGPVHETRQVGGPVPRVSEVQPTGDAVRGEVGSAED